MTYEARRGPRRPLRLADQFFFLAHDCDSGPIAVRLHEAGLSIGLAGALIGELLVEQRVTIRDGAVTAISRQPSGDLLSQSVLDEVLAEPPHPVRVWLDYLSTSSLARVRSRLTVAGELAEVRVRRWWGGSTSGFRAVDEYQPLHPEFAVQRLLESPPSGDTGLTDFPTIHTTMVAALADATDLFERLLGWTGEQATFRARLDRLRARLPSPYTQLVEHTRAAVGDAVLANRRTR